MCIIIYKSKGTAAKVEWDTLKTCFTNNPDGAGYAIAYNDKLLLKKGFMSFHDFKMSLEQTLKGVNIHDAGILFHFRITTHGGTSRANTHPFPLGRDSLTDRKYTGLDACVAMNGICLSNTGYKSSISDTMDAVESLINPLYKMYGDFWKKEDAHNIFSFLGAKWAILEKDGMVTSFGAFHNLQGWTYSNYSYIERKAYQYSYTSPYTSDNWKNLYLDDDDDYAYPATVDSTPAKSYHYDLIEYEGNVMELSSNKIKTVKLSDMYYMDDDGDLYLYDWETDDYLYLADEVPISE